MKKGALFVVATPIGNLDDISKRAIDTLKNVYAIFAERPDWSRKLLNYFDIHKPLFQYSEGTKNRVFSKIVKLLEQNRDIALISDAGTPLISDPGAQLIRAVRENGFDVIAIPGASALIAAVSVAGIAAPFVFLGFLPRKRGEIIAVLENIEECAGRAIFYESPGRIMKTLNIVEENFPDARIYLCKELTKINESYYEGRAGEVIEMLENPEKGEYTCIIEMRKKSDNQNLKQTALKLGEEGLSRKDIAKCMKVIYGVRKKRVFEWIS